MTSQQSLEQMLTQFQAKIYAMQGEILMAKKALRDVLENMGDARQIAAEALDKLDNLDIK